VYGVIGEGDSDTETLKVLIRRLAENPRLPVKIKSFGGCSRMLKDGARQLQAFIDIGMKKLIVAYDADGHPTEQCKNLVISRIVQPSQTENICCALIPKEEIEAWILADVEALEKVCRWWRVSPVTGDPESIPNPKDHLEGLNRHWKGKPAYSHVVHNSRVAGFLNLDTVHRRCPSFRPLKEFVKS
jgi:Domain of unknown function (DUF4276)